MQVLITGATGFVGARLVETLSMSSIFVPIAAIRKQNSDIIRQVKTVLIDDFSPNNLWGNILNNIDVVIHTAARVHVMNEREKDPLSEFRRVNVEGTLNLAKQASAAGVKRFIFISSIKVNGERTNLNEPFTENDIPAPVDPYGISKLETEVGLGALAKETGMEVVCIRPPLVYGPGVKANFLNMMRWIKRGVPLPFGAIYNKRSLVALDNLIDLIVTCIDHPNAVNQIFLAGDGYDLSTTELLQRVAEAMKKKACLWPVPEKSLEICLSLLGKNNLAQRLCGSLQLDISKSKQLLSWEPPVSIDYALQRTVNFFLDRN